MSKCTCDLPSSIDVRRMIAGAKNEEDGDVLQAVIIGPISEQDIPIQVDLSYSYTIDCLNHLDNRERNATFRRQ